MENEDNKISLKLLIEWTFKLLNGEFNFKDQYTPIY